MIKKWIVNNFWTKAASVCLAVLVWLYVSGEENTQLEHDIPVNVKLPQGFVLVQISSSAVKTTFRGAKSILQQMQTDEMQYSRDLRGQTQPGKITFLVSENDIPLPKFVTIANMYPKEITLSIDRIAEKELAVEPVLQGNPMDGFKVEGVSVNPSSVEVKGPAAVLRRSIKIGTLPVDLTGRNRSFFQKVRLSPIFSAQESDIAVEVYVRIREQVEEKVFDNHPIKVLQSLQVGWKAQLEPQTASVLLGGNKEMLSKLKPSEVTLFIDLADLKPGTYELPLQTKAPKEVTILKTTPEKVHVKIQEGANK